MSILFSDMYSLDKPAQIRLAVYLIGLAIEMDSRADNRAILIYMEKNPQDYLGYINTAIQQANYEMIRARYDLQDSGNLKNYHGRIAYNILRTVPHIDYVPLHLRGQL